MSAEDHPIFQNISVGKESCPKKLLTTHDGCRVVVIQGDTIRLCSSGDSQYQIIECGINTVTGAALNNSGTLLCAYNETELQVIVLPSPFVSSHGGILKPHTYNITVKSPIKQVQWHPRGKLDSVPVVLHKDDTIAMYELYNEDFQQPTAVLNTMQNQLGVTSHVTDVESMCFSKDGLTLYLLNSSEGGDVYALYPFLPSVLVIPEQHLETCFYKSCINYENLSSDDSPIVKRNVIKQLQFVSRLHKQYKSETVDKARNGDLVFNIQESYRDAKIQGPFTINPFAEKLYSATAIQITTMPIDEFNELILVYFDNGTVLQCFQDLDLRMCWGEIDSSSNNSLVVLEFLDVPSGQIICLTPHKFAVLGPKSFVVDSSEWTKALSECIISSNLEVLSQINIKSTITPVNGAFTQAGLWESNGEKQLIFMSDKSVKSITLPGSTKTKDAVSKTVQPVTGVKYKPVFSQPIGEILLLNKKFQSECSRATQTVIPPHLMDLPLQNDSNEDQLALLTDISKEIFSKIIQGQTLGLLIHNRLFEQRYELTRQLEHSSEILHKAKCLQERYPDQNSKWEHVFKKQENIDSRFEKLQSRLNEISSSGKLKDLTISQREMEWFKEIKSQVSLFNKFVMQQQDVKEQLEFVQSELKTAGERRVSKEDVFDWAELQELLSVDSKIIKECNEGLVEAAKELDEKI